MHSTAMRFNFLPSLRRRHRPPHHWRTREAARHFVVGYVAEAESPAAPRLTAPERWRYASAIFRLGEQSDRILLWVADQALGSTSHWIEGVHAGIRRDLWQANEEARQWVGLVEEAGERAQFSAYASFVQFDRAVDGLVGSTIASLPPDLLDDSVAPRNFDLRDRGLDRPLDHG